MSKVVGFHTRPVICSPRRLSNGYFREGFPVISSSQGIHPAVQAFAATHSIVSSNEIAALNEVYNELYGVVADNGAGDVYFLNGKSPTSYAASLAALVPGAGLTTAGVGGTAPTHSNDGLLFNGTSNYLNYGPIQNNKPQNELLLAFSRTNTIATNGVSMGVNHSGTLQFAPRSSANTSGFITGNQYTSSQNFAGPGNWIGYNDGTNYAIWKDGVKQVPDAPLAISTSLTGTNDFYMGARNQLGSASNFVEERAALVILLWDGGTLFSQTLINRIDLAMFNYNANVV